MSIKKLWLFVILSFITGLIWGRVFCNAHSKYYLDPELIENYDDIAAIYVIRNGDDISLIAQETGELIFEFNRFKEADKESFKEYEDLLEEMSGLDY